MIVTASISLFTEPGFIASLLVCFTLAYLMAVKAHPFWQIGLCIFFGSYDITHWMDGKYGTIALYWTYAGWCGFIFQKIGGGELLRGLSRSLRERFQNVGNSAPQPAVEQEPYTDAEGNDAQRERDYWKAQADYERRERERAEEANWRQRNSDPEDHPESDPEPEPSQAGSDPPEPEEHTKRSWWEVLEISPDADKAAIKKAYRKKIQKYHPDMVSHLGEEFQEIAERKAKEINAAYDEAMGRS